MTLKFRWLLYYTMVNINRACFSWVPFVLFSFVRKRNYVMCKTWILTLNSSCSSFKYLHQNLVAVIFYFPLFSVRWCLRWTQSPYLRGSLADFLLFSVRWRLRWTRYPDLRGSLAEVWGGFNTLTWQNHWKLRFFALIIKSCIKSLHIVDTVIYDDRSQLP